MLAILKDIAERVRSRFSSALANPDDAPIESPIVRSRNAAVIDALIGARKPICIEFGEQSKRLDGWITADCGPGADLRLDLSRPLPLPDGCVSKIYSSHFLEHLVFPNILMQHLRECHRILLPGGALSVAVPNARIWIDAYLRGKIDEQQFCGYTPAYSYHSPIDYVNYLAYMGGEHKHLFDQENLVAILRDAGFENARARDFDPSMDVETRNRQSIYAEASKEAP